MVFSSIFCKYLSGEVSPSEIVNMEKRSRGVGPSLSVEDTEYLKKNTKYSDEDIKIWFRSGICSAGKHLMILYERNFKKDCPSGILEKKKVTEIYEEKIVPNKDCKYLVDQLFRIIDDDNNGGIDFKVIRTEIYSAPIINIFHIC